MPDDLPPDDLPSDIYDRDILAWSERQSGLLRRLADGERVNDLDWPHIIDEVESVGRSELRACRSLLRQAIAHLLKLHGWPASSYCEPWRSEATVFLVDAADSFSPSMRQNIDVTDLYHTARALTETTRIDGAAPATLPTLCPFTLDDLLTSRPNLDSLLGKRAAA